MLELNIVPVVTQTPKADLPVDMKIQLQDDSTTSPKEIALVTQMSFHPDTASSGEDIVNNDK